MSVVQPGASSPFVLRTSKLRILSPLQMASLPGIGQLRRADAQCGFCGSWAALQCGSTRLDNVALSARATTTLVTAMTTAMTRYDDKDWRGARATSRATETCECRSQELRELEQREEEVR
jgi:hypothetical protein